MDVYVDGAVLSHCVQSKVRIATMIAITEKTYIHRKLHITLQLSAKRAINLLQSILRPANLIAPYIPYEK